MQLSHEQTLDWIQQHRAWRLARKTKPIWARAVEPDEIGKAYQTADRATERAKEGYWLCVGVAGEPWFQKLEKIEAKYDRAGQENKQFAFDAQRHSYQVFKPKGGVRNWAAQVDGPKIEGFSIRPNYDVEHPLYSPAGGYVVRDYVSDPYRDKPNDVWLVQQTVFESTYEFLSKDARLARIRAAKMPAINKPVMFNTSEADAILSALEVFPPDNPWNQVVSDWPVHPNSPNIIASIGADKPLRYNPDMGFILVPPGQKKVAVEIIGYPGESDPGPFPIPENLPIEGWPVCALRDANYRNWTLDDIQRDRDNRGGDRHGIVVDPVNRLLYEFFGAKKTDRGWTAMQSSKFDLKTNQLRPDGWTSADAAGLPIFPAVVRYDELKRGLVEHAMRVTVVKTRRAYVAPATHYASRHTNEEYPRMGERIRLRQDYDISGFSPEVQAILKGLKKYGMFVADNGIDWAISVAPDERIPVLHEELRRVKGSAFEVVTEP